MCSLAACAVGFDVMTKSPNHQITKSPDGFAFRRQHRLRRRGDFDAVFDARCRKHAGPVTVLLRPNGLAHSRLGIITPRRIGNAVKRHRLQRLLREAFRLDRHDYPAAYDIVVLVRPHEPQHRDDYRRLLADAVRRGDRVWQRRAKGG